MREPSITIRRHDEPIGVPASATYRRHTPESPGWDDLVRLVEAQETRRKDRERLRTGEVSHAPRPAPPPTKTRTHLIVEMLRAAGLVSRSQTETPR